MVWILLKVNKVGKLLPKSGFFNTGIIVLLLMIEFRTAKTNNEKQIHSNEQGVDIPYKGRLEKELKLENISDPIQQNNWRPIAYNATNGRKMYLTKVNVFESQKITNNSDLLQNMTKISGDKVLPNLFRTLRLANAGRSYDKFDDVDDDYSRQKKRYRHSKRVRIIKPPNFLVPPKTDDQSGVFENEAKQFYRVYQTKYEKIPGYKSLEESSSESRWKEADDKDSFKRNPRVKKVRRKPINYLRPPVITLTTTEHIFFINPKETTPMSYTDNYPQHNDEDMSRTTTDRNTQNVTRSLDDNITLKPIKYRVTFPTTTEMNFVDQTTQTTVKNTSTSSDSYYNTDSTPRTYNFANSPVSVYSVNDIFGLGGTSSNNWRIQNKINDFNDSKSMDFMMVKNSSERDGRYYDGQSRTIETGGVYVIDTPNFSNREALWPASNYRSPSSKKYVGIETGATYGRPETSRNYENREINSAGLRTSKNYGGLESSTIYRQPETTKNYENQEIPGLGTSKKYGGPEFGTTYGRPETTKNYENLEHNSAGLGASKTYGSPEFSTTYGRPETTKNYENQDAGLGTAKNYGGPESIITYKRPETTTNYKNSETSENNYGSLETTTNYRNPGSTTSAYIYSDEVLKSSSYIPDDVSGFYVTNDYRTTGDKLSTLSGIQSGILIQEINAMVPNSSSTSSFNQEEISVNTESYFESTKMDKNLMSPEVQKTGMSVSKLELNNINKSDGLHNWISRFNPEGRSFKSNGRNFGGSNNGVDNSFDYQDLSLKHPADRQVKLHVAESGHFHKGQTVERGLLLQQNNVIPGEAGSDYPILSKPALSSRMMCKADGLRYVADVSSGCQVFYMCVGEGPGEPMLCPNGTLFSQDFLVCDWWYNVECRYK